MRKQLRRTRHWIGGIVLAATALLAGPSLSEPLVDPPPGTILPRVFSFRVTDIRADKTDPELNKFHFEFEVENWSDVFAGGLEISLATPTPPGVAFTANSFSGIDADGRPLFLEDVNNDTEINSADLEDSNGNGILDLGEDKNSNQRLDNDPMPGNILRTNNWTQVSQTASKVVWSAPPLNNPTTQVDGIQYRNLIAAAEFGGASDPYFSAQCVPGIEEGTATVDVDGRISPVEAIDDGVNVLDGFVMTIDGLDAGVAVSMNWFLTSAGFQQVSLVPIQCQMTMRPQVPLGDPIGTATGGNPYGYGVLTIERIDAGAPSGPVFDGTKGVGNEALEFFGGVSTVPDPAIMAAEFGFGLTAQFVNPTDNTLGATVNAVPTSPDSDGDGIPDSGDQCSDSNLDATIVIGSCDSGVANVAFANGCTLADLIDERLGNGDDSDSDGVERLLRQLRREGVLSRGEVRAIRRCLND